MQHSNLNYILEIYKAKSISKAAEKLKISQPALSSHIRKIEEQLGVRIFDRSIKPLQLTEAGQLYITYMRKQIELERELQEQISDLDCLRRGSLILGGASFFNVSYLPEAIGQFLKKYGGIEITVVDGNLPEIVRKSLDNEIDLFLAPSWDMDSRCCYEKILDEKLFLCVPPEWEINKELEAFRIPEEVILRGDTDDWIRGKKEPYVDFKVFSDCTFITLKEEQHIGNLMAQLFRRHGFEPKHHILVEQTMTSYAITLAGAGVSLVAEGTLVNGNLKRFPAFYLADTDICSRDMYVAYPKQKYLSRASKEFIAVLKNSLNALYDKEK